jgi:hypothetical protein
MRSTLVLIAVAVAVAISAALPPGPVCFGTAHACKHDLVVNPDDPQALGRVQLYGGTRIGIPTLSAVWGEEESGREERA